MKRDVLSARTHGATETKPGLRETHSLIAGKLRGSSALCRKGFAWEGRGSPVSLARAPRRDRILHQATISAIGRID